MLAVLAFIAFAIALLMHLFGWGSGNVDVLLFALAGFALLAAHLAFVPARSLPWRRPPP